MGRTFSIELNSDDLNPKTVEHITNLDKNKTLSRFVSLLLDIYIEGYDFEKHRQGQSTFETSQEVNTTSKDESQFDIDQLLKIVLDVKESVEELKDRGSDNSEIIKLLKERPVIPISPMPQSSIQNTTQISPKSDVSSINNTVEKKTIGKAGKGNMGKLAALKKLKG